MSQGDALMRRKMEMLIHKQRVAAEQVPEHTFRFAEQLSPPRGAGAASSATTPIPDNWNGTQSATGTYFAQRREEQQQHLPLGVPPYRRDDAGGSAAKPQQHHLHPVRLSPEERQQRLDAIIQQRIVNALEEQRASEEARLDACKHQRDVEIMKFHQRMKNRSELQFKSQQLVLGHSVDQMGLGSWQQQTQVSTGTRAAAERDEHRLDAHRQFIEFNRDRLERNLLHRQYCVESHAERVRFRQGLEAHVGTIFSKTKTRILTDMGVSGPEATFTGFQTVDDLKQQQAQLQERANSKTHEDDEARAAYDELAKFDALLWDRLRERKGKKCERVREIAYRIDSPQRGATQAQHA